MVSDCMLGRGVVDASLSDEAGSVGCKDVVDCRGIAVNVGDGWVSCVEVVSDESFVGVVEADVLSPVGNGGMTSARACD